MEDVHFTTEDRKVLNELTKLTAVIASKVDDARDDIKDIRIGLASRVDSSEKAIIGLQESIKSVNENSFDRFKENKDVGDDHETRLRRLEYALFIITGVYFALLFYFNYFHK